MHIKNVNIHLSGAPSVALLAALSGAFAPGGAPVEKASRPAIGQYWEGQGGVYVGVGRGYEGALDYCLILPTDPSAIFTKRMLGTYGIDVPNAGSIHDGPANTAALAAAGSALCKEILDLEIDGRKDFYLMSRTDARLCWVNVPELFEKEWYLTSSQCSACSAWVQHFSCGGQGSSYFGEFYARARACRRLFL